MGQRPALRGWRAGGSSNLCSGHRCPLRPAQYLLKRSICQRIDKLKSARKSRPYLWDSTAGECGNDEDCAGTQTCDNGYCIEPVVCGVDADCRAGRYCNDESQCASPCIQLRAGEVIEDAGEYVARLGVADCGGNEAEATMTVVVLERPIADRAET